MRKVQVGGSQSPNTSFPLSGHTRYPGATGAASELCSCWVSLHPHPYLWTRVISGHRSKHSLHLPLPLLLLRCHKKSPYYEPSNLGPATIGIWHQIFISPLDTISVTSDRHGSPISPVHLSCSRQPTTQCRLRNDKKQKDRVWAKKASLGWRRRLLYLERERGER